MLTACGLTDIGLVRPVNQDDIFVSPEPFGILPNLFLVADGMGGHNGGEIASQMAIAHFKEYIQRNADENILDLLSSAAQEANLQVLEQAEADPALSGMGTTLTGCTIYDGKCVIIHIGDSRAYAINGPQISLMTQDHSYVNEMVKAGQITEAEARGHPKRNVLTKVLGISPDMSADGYIHELEQCSVVLLCSDGLYNMVPDEEIVNIVNTSENPAEALVAAAISNGGADNISVIVVR